MLSVHQPSRDAILFSWDVTLLPSGVLFWSLDQSNWMLSPSRLDKPCCGLQVQIFLQFVHKKEQDKNHKLVDCCFFFFLSGNPHCHWFLQLLAHANIVAIDSIAQLDQLLEFPCLQPICICKHCFDRSPWSIDAVVWARCLRSLHFVCYHDRTCNRWLQSLSWSIMQSLTAIVVAVNRLIIRCELHCNWTSNH